MAKRKGKKRSTHRGLLKNGDYAVKGATNKRPSRKVAGEKAASEREASKKRLKDARKMAKIEAYAKENNVTIAQAMIHFM